MRILNSFSVGQLADRLGSGLGGEDVERPLQAESGPWLDRDGEPEVEIVVAQVVVRDAGVRVDDLRRPVRVLGVDLRGHEHRLVAERPRVEDRRDLADDPLVEQPLDAGHHLVLGQPREPGDVRERPRREGEAALHQVQQLLVRLVERDRGAVPARADLQASHRATSFAW